MRRLVPENAPELFRRRYDAGLDAAAIAAEYQVTPETVRFYLRQSAGWVKRPHKPWTPERCQLAVDLYLKGLTQKQVAEKLGANRRHVRAALYAAGVTIRESFAFPTGADNPAYNGGIILRKGYRYLLRPNHPHATRNGYVAEHRLVMEGVLGRYLDPKEVVHHKNKNPLDNRPENLQVFASNAEHLAEELRGQCPNWSEDGKRRLHEAAQRHAIERRKPR